MQLDAEGKVTKILQIMKENHLEEEQQKAIFGDLLRWVKGRQTEPWEAEAVQGVAEQVQLSIVRKISELLQINQSAGPRREKSTGEGKRKSTAGGGEGAQTPVSISVPRKKSTEEREEEEEYKQAPVHRIVPRREKSTEGEGEKSTVQQGGGEEEEATVDQTSGREGEEPVHYLPQDVLQVQNTTALTHMTEGELTERMIGGNHWTLCALIFFCCKSSLYLCSILMYYLHFFLQFNLQLPESCHSFFLPARS